MKVAVLGAGKMGSFHACTLRAHPAVSEVRIFDINLASGRTHETLEATLDGVNAVVIATPAPTHAILIHRCLDMGLPVFCEKPIAVELDETMAVVDRVERTRGLLQVGFQRRFDGAYRGARQRIEDGSLGDIYAFYMPSHDRTPPSQTYIATSGGLFKDLHIHDFDTIRWLFGQEVDEVYARGEVLGFPIFREYGDVDTSAILLKLAGGPLGVLTGGRHSPRGYDVRAEIFGSQDTIRIEVGERHTDFLSRFGEAYRAELDHFLRMARGEAASPCTARDALEALRIAVACDRSLDERRPVRLSEGPA